MCFLVYHTIFQCMHAMYCVLVENDNPMNCIACCLKLCNGNSVDIWLYRDFSTNNKLTCNLVFNDNIKGYACIKLIEQDKSLTLGYFTTSHKDIQSNICRVINKCVVKGRVHILHCTPYIPSPCITSCIRRLRLARMMGSHIHID
jgi:hypothetical protein